MHLFILQIMSVLCALMFMARAAISLSEDYPFRNTSLDWNTRVNDLVYRLTLEVITVTRLFSYLYLSEQQANKY
jgi:hypothetical protein